MAENKAKETMPEEEEAFIITLTDDDGNEFEFELLAEYEKDGNKYLAVIEVQDEDDNTDVLEYVILKMTEENGEEFFSTIDDEEELDNIADYFDDLFTKEIDYDN